MGGRVLAHTNSRLLGSPLSALADPGPGPWQWRQPLRLRDGLEGFAVLTYDAALVERQLDERVRRTMARVAAIAAVMLLAGLSAAWWLAASFSRPIAELEAAAGLIGTGRLDTRIQVERKDELGRLGLRFNAMAEKLQELDQLKRDFVSAVTHELKSPLAAIESYLALMLFEARRAGQEHPWERDLTNIRAQTGRLSRFIADLLDLAKIERAQFALQPCRLALPPVIDEVAHAFAPMAVEAGVRLALAPAPPGLLDVQADPDRVRQVLVNLVSNALKFTPSGGTVQIELEPAGRSVACTVTDSGPGIPREVRERLFEKFVQGRGARASSRGPKGTGLGLAISKSIVEAHGGRITLKEAPAGMGASFCFTLPCAAIGPGSGPGGTG